MIHLRRISQFLFLALFIYLLLNAVDPHSPLSLFFISDPLIAITTIIASRIFTLILLVSLVIIVISIFLGRVFCGWACPLGTTIDIFDWIIPKKLRIKKTFLPLRRIKYLLLVIIIILAILGVNIVGWFDPLSISFRAFGLVLYPAMDSLLKGSVIDNWGFRNLSGPLESLGILDRNNIYFQGSIIFLLMFLVILFLGIIQNRFWCRNLCPLGALLGVLSRWRSLRIKIDANCNKCGECVKICKMGAIKDELIGLDEECIQCFTCVNTCPSGAITLGFKGKKIPEESVLPSRRAFLTASLLGVLSFPLLRKGLCINKNPGLPILRPPGAHRSEETFLAKCIQCGKCMKICPTNGLQPLLFQAGLYAMWTPILIPRIGYCSYNCNLCTQVCPTEALQPLQIKEKVKWKIGVASINQEICIRCGTCEEYCPIPEKAIKIVRAPDHGIDHLYVVRDLCTGCGLCEHKCLAPDKAIRIWPLSDGISNTPS